MNTINVDTLEVRPHAAARKYAILSHRWGAEEVSYEEIVAYNWKRRHPDMPSPTPWLDRDIAKLAGWQKIVKACEQAKADGLNYLWCDTCCIDKRSSAELSEAINSMYKWYRDAVICYAYLADVKDIGDFAHSEWFSRSWTLQELLAPNNNMRLYNRNWEIVGLRCELTVAIAATTGIDVRILRKESRLEDYSVAQRMSWAARRRTTRPEDEAYALLGVFDINMPLLYGEGRRAFGRLQEEIIRTHPDQSIFAWRYGNPDAMSCSDLLASNPRDFKYCSEVISARDLSNPHEHYDLTSVGLRVPTTRTREGQHVFILTCGLKGRKDAMAITLEPVSEDWNRRMFQCSGAAMQWLGTVDLIEAREFATASIIIRQASEEGAYTGRLVDFLPRGWIECLPFPTFEDRCSVVGHWPHNSWNGALEEFQFVSWDIQSFGFKVRQRDKETGSSRDWLVCAAFGGHHESGWGQTRRDFLAYNALLVAEEKTFMRMGKMHGHHLPDHKCLAKACEVLIVAAKYAGPRFENLRNKTKIVSARLDNGRTGIAVGLRHKVVAQVPSFVIEIRRWRQEDVNDRSEMESTFGWSTVPLDRAMAEILGWDVGDPVMDETGWEKGRTPPPRLQSWTLRSLRGKSQGPQ